MLHALEKGGPALRSCGEAWGRTSRGETLQTEVLPEVDFSYALIINDFFRLAVGEDGAFVDDVSAVADAESLSHIMIGDDDADPPLFQEPDDLLDLEHGDRIDAREG